MTQSKGRSTCAVPHHAVPWLNTCFCFIGVSCKPQEATPARVSGSTFCPSSSTLHLGQSFHPHITVYFYPYYKTGLESQIKTASIFQLISFQMTGSRPSEPPETMFRNGFPLRSKIQVPAVQKRQVKSWEATFVLRQYSICITGVTQEHLWLEGCNEQ